MILGKYDTFEAWYEDHLQIEFEFLTKFVENLELQITLGIQEYKEKVETEVHPYGNPYDDDKQVYTYVQENYLGMDGSFWNLTELFVEQYPALQRSSCFLTLHGFVEKEFNQLCELIRTRMSLKVRADDLKLEGIRRSVNYLAKVCGVQITWQDFDAMKLESLIQLRNCIIHRGGSIVDKSGELNKNLSTFITTTNFLEINSRNEVVIKSGFLSHVLTLYREILERTIAQIILLNLPMSTQK